MEEGERLSKKQAVQEGTIKKLRASLKEATEACTQQEAALASERQRLQDALAARAAADEARQVLWPCCIFSPAICNAAQTQLAVAAVQTA